MSVSKEPINKIITEINRSSQKRIILAGLPGSGKTTVLNNYEDNFHESDILLVNGTVNTDEEIQIYDMDLIKLYHVSLIVYKLLTKIRDLNKVIFLHHFIRLNYTVENILQKISLLCKTRYYEYKDVYISKEYLEYPESLLKEFISILNNCLAFRDITVLIDNFDAFGDSNPVYQTFIYRVLSDYVNLLVTASSLEVKENSQNKVIKLDYNQNVLEVRNILATQIENVVIEDAGFKRIVNVNSILSDELIQEMIDKTDGNLFTIISIVRIALRFLQHFDPLEYEKIIQSLLKENDPVISGQIKRERILHI